MTEPSQTRRDFLKVVGAAGAMAAAWPLSHCGAEAAPAPSAGPEAQPGAAAPRRPNVLFILSDDHRWNAMSCAGHPFLKTPNMDRLAAEGVRFANAFCTTSLCSPSRASLLSGLYAHTHGVLNNFTDYPANLPSWPRRLQACGYETAYIGKWHMSEQSDEIRPGFDFWMSHKGQGKYYGTEFNINGKRETPDGYYTHVVTQATIDWLKRPHSKPFALILGHKAPHGPFQPEPKYEHVLDNVEIKEPPTSRDYKDPAKPEWIRQRVPTWHGIDGPLYGLKEYGKFMRSYLATILSVDDSIGRIYETLRELGQLDNTLLIYMTDNGFLLGEHGMIDKRTMNEDSIRLPMLVRYPPLFSQPRVVTEQVLSIDVAPSILDICGAAPLEKVHGLSWKRLAAGDAAGWRHAWYYEYNYEKEFPYTPNVRGVRIDNWKYMHCPHGDGGPDRHKAELYDLRADPLELHNLIDDPAAAGKLKELKAELEHLQAACDALPDRMPLDEGIKTALPEQSIR